MTAERIGKTPRGRRPGRPSGDTREQAILDTAVQLIQERPFAEISVEELSRGAGISRPTFYFYFASKEEVLLALLVPLIQRAETGFNSVQADILSHPQHTIRRGIEIFFSSFDSQPAAVKAGVEALRTLPEFQAFWANLMEKWIVLSTAMITAERHRGAAPELLPARDLAISLNLMNERMIMMTLGGEQPSVDKDRVVKTLTHVWLTSIYGVNQLQM